MKSLEKSIAVSALTQRTLIKNYAPLTVNINFMTTASKHGLPNPKLVQFVALTLDQTAIISLISTLRTILITMIFYLMISLIVFVFSKNQMRSSCQHSGDRLKLFQSLRSAAAWTWIIPSDCF